LFSWYFFNHFIHPTNINFFIHEKKNYYKIIVNVQNKDIDKIIYIRKIPSFFAFSGVNCPPKIAETASVVNFVTHKKEVANAKNNIIGKQQFITETNAQQANLMAFIDAFRIFAVACIVIIPLIFLIKGIKDK
jgi:hypothetical protein